MNSCFIISEKTATATKQTNEQTKPGVNRLSGVNE